MPRCRSGTTFPIDRKWLRSAPAVIIAGRKFASAAKLQPILIANDTVVAYRAADTKSTYRASTSPRAVDASVARQSTRGPRARRSSSWAARTPLAPSSSPPGRTRSSARSCWKPSIFSWTGPAAATSDPVEGESKSAGPIWAPRQTSTARGTTCGPPENAAVAPDPDGRQFGALNRVHRPVPPLNLKRKTRH